MSELTTELHESAYRIRRFALRMGEAAQDGVVLAGVAVQQQGLHLARIRLGERGQHVAAAVAAAIIHEQQFPGAPKRPARRQRAPHRGADLRSGCPRPARHP